MSISTNTGAVISIRGGVVDARFEKDLPPIYRVLRTGTDNNIVIEVQEQLAGC